MEFVQLFRYLKAVLGTAGLAKDFALSKRKRALEKFINVGRTIHVQVNLQPRVSFIIPVYNGAEHTLPCLLSILELIDVPFEIIIVDDGCSDKTTELLNLFQGLRIRRNSRNLGTLHSNNVGAKLARGDYLVFMNNDACFLEGSLQRELKLFETEENCGYMGPRVSQLNGGLQEAGALIYRDGTTNGYLRYHSVDDLRAMFQRDVDYCSSLFAIVERRTFISMNGFDEIYSPAYFEETDFCMRIRKAGMRCIYNPRLLVNHFEFGSSSKVARAKQQIEARKVIFLNRWSSALVKEKYYEKEISRCTDVAALRLTDRPRRLVVTCSVPDGQNQLDGHSGFTAYFILNGQKNLIFPLVASKSIKIAFAFGAKRELLNFAARRKGFFDEIVADPSIDKGLMSLVKACSAS